jgi:myo-inositol-1(or 4)-monophosphatase
MSTDVDETRLLAVALQAARAGAAELLPRFGGGDLHVRAKSTPTDPVSEADLASEAAIRAVLGRERRDDAILGEEGGATGPVGGGPGDGVRWVVDPLDGTVNFLYGIPTFAVSVACEDASGAIAGVVLDPVRGECFTATRSGPALRDGEVVQGSTLGDLSRALVATGFAYDPGVRAAQARVAAAILPRARDLRRAGSAALDLCGCACGRVDAYYERGVRPWDTAAGALICSRAGLTVRALAATDEQPDGIVVAPPALIDELYGLASG